MSLASSSGLCAASPLAAYVGEVISLSRAYSTACSKVIARPSAHAAVHLSSPNLLRAKVRVRWSEAPFVPKGWNEVPMLEKAACAAP